MKGTLVQKEDIAKGTMFFKFSLPEDIEFQSGDVFHIKLSEDLKRHFTIVNSPNEKRTVSVATRMRDSEFKKTLGALQVGQTAEIYFKTKGQFVLPTDTSMPLVFIALGIGITPYVSMLRYIQEQKLPFRTTLIYSDSDRESMAFLGEIQEYAKDNPNFKLILTITKDSNWTGEKRHIDSTFVQGYIKLPKESVYYISGPPAAVVAVSDSLKSLGIAPDHIHASNFSGY